MSRSNIIDISPAVGEIANVFGAEELGAVGGGAGIIVTFQSHRGGTLRYLYTGEAAVEIENGADPAAYPGTRVD
jgi:hypothetical protein